MMRSARIMGSALVLVLTVSAACSDEAAPPAPPVTYQEIPKPTREPTVETPTAANVPVVEDFQDEAEAEITPDTFRAELDRIEAEIGNEQP